MRHFRNFIGGEMTDLQKRTLAGNRLLCLVENRPDRFTEIHASDGSEIRAGRGIGLIVCGNVLVMRADMSDKVLLNRLGPGDLFGMANLYGSENQCTAVVADGDTEFLFLPEEECRRLVRENPRFAEEYIALLSDKIRFLNRRISDFSAPDVESKVARALLSGRYISKTMTGLSRQLGIGRASLYRVLDLFEAEGLIQKNGRAVTVIDGEKLSKHV